MVRLRHQPRYGFDDLPQCNDGLPLPNGKRKRSGNRPYRCGRKVNHRGPHVAFTWDEEGEHRLVYATWVWVEGDLFVDVGL